MHRMLACTSKCRLDSGMQDLGVIDDVSLPIWGREGHANDGADITPRLMEDDSGMSVGPGVLFSSLLARFRSAIAIAYMLECVAQA
jgi:hypothetical protein